MDQKRWSPMEPKYGRDSLLWMIEEIGEVIAIVKKKKEYEIMEIKRLEKNRRLFESFETLGEGVGRVVSS